MKRLVPLTLLVLIGCASAVRPHSSVDDGPHTVTDELASLGDWMLWAGAITVILGSACRAYFGKAATLAVLAIEIGAITVAFGIASLYVAAHPWILPATSGVAGVAMAYRYRVELRKWFGIGATTESTPPVLTTSITASNAVNRG